MTAFPGVQPINELAHVRKPTWKHILRREAIYQFPWRVGSQRRLYFLDHTFRYFSNFYKLQLNKSNRGSYKSLCLIGNLLAIGSEKEAGRSNPACALLLPSLDTLRRKVVSKLIPISIKPKGDQRQPSSEGFLKTELGEEG